jgi:AcrR family transcriptional regulator
LAREERGSIWDLELSRRERKKEETKEWIFRAAFTLFKQRGVDETTIDEICAKADVAKGTFFNYFPHKQAVFSYLADQWFREAEAQAAAILARPGRAGPQLVAMFAEGAASYEQEPVLAKCVLQAREMRPAGVDASAAHGDRADV